MTEIKLSPAFTAACTKMTKVALHAYIYRKPPRIIRRIADKHGLIGDERRRFGAFAGDAFRRARSLSMRCFPGRMIEVAGLVGIFFGFPIGGITGFTLLSQYIGLLGLFVGMALGFIVVFGALVALSIAQGYVMFRRTFLRQTASAME